MFIDTCEWAQLHLQAQKILEKALSSVAQLDPDHSQWIHQSAATNKVKPFQKKELRVKHVDSYIGIV